MLAKYERTSPKYPTDGPGNGLTWNAYFKLAKSGNLAPGVSDELGTDLAEVDGGGLGDTTILQSGYEPVGGELAAGVNYWADCARASGLGAPTTGPRPVLSYLKLLLANDWITVVGYAHSFRGGGHYGKAAERAGEKKPDFDIITHSVEGYKKGKGKVRIVYQSRASERGGAFGAASPVLRRATGIGADNVPDKELKAWITS